MLFDLRLALRTMRRQPAVVTAAILTVGLAVAANAALFSVFDGLLFRPLPFANVDRMVHVEVPAAVRRFLSPEEFKRLTEVMATTPLLEQRFAARPSLLLEEGAADVRAWALRPVAVSHGWLEQFGVKPVAGRLVDPGNENGFLMGEDLWRSRYGGDKSLIGANVRLPGMIFARSTVLAGIVPREFTLPDGGNIWFGIGGDIAGNFNFARLAPDVSIEQVRALLPRAVVTPLREHVRPDGAFALAALLIATALLLVIAWVQVAALLFARAVGRASELGVRLALGATRAQLIRQFAAEGVVVALAALGVAWILAAPLTLGVIALLPEEMTRGQLLAPDLRTGGFAMAVALAGVVMLAIVPADLVRRTSPLTLMRGSLFSSVRRGALRWRTGMLVGQLAVTVVLLYMSGLAVNSFSRIAAIDLGFKPDRVVAFRQPPMTTTSGGAATPEERRAHIARQVQAVADTYDALRVLPGVAFAAGGRIPFLETRVAGGASVPFEIQIGPDNRSTERAFLNTTTPDYARVLGLTLAEGRLPSEDDVAPGQAVALVNDTFAKMLAQRGPVLGETLTANNRTSTIIGVVKDFVVDRPDRRIEPMMLVVLRNPQAFFLVRLADGAEGDQAAAAVGATFDRIWPGHPSRDVVTVAGLAERSIADYRARATMLVLIGVLCLPLALTGIAGALTYATEQRAREIGIRIALGATPADIGSAIIRTAAIAIASGLIAGLAGGVLMGRVMTSYLFRVGGVDPITIVGVTGVLAIVGVCAAWLPARRAARTEPSTALREGT
jgi:putative ABC transport system permease protein